MKNPRRKAGSFFSDKEKLFLLEIAKKAIGKELSGERFEIGENALPSKRLKEERGTFVTLTLGGNLRGCIGHILPVQGLYQDVIENARAAAFSDPRFPPLSEDEFKKIKIEISILSRPEKFDYATPIELTDYLEKERPGVIIKKGLNAATFLPQVWEELPKPEDFLAHLCLKAGLASDAWRDEIKIETYKVEIIRER